MTPELLKNIQAALQAQFQAGYTTAQLDQAIIAVLPAPPPPVPPPAEPEPTTADSHSHGP